MTVPPQATPPMGGERKVGIRVNVDGSVSEVELLADLGGYDTKDLLGSWTEPVNVIQVDRTHMIRMWVDEQGHLKRLPINRIASRFYPAPGNPAGAEPGDPPIVGDVIFTVMEMRHDPEPDWYLADMSDEARGLLREKGVEL